MHERLCLHLWKKCNGTTLPFCRANPSHHARTFESRVSARSLVCRVPAYLDAEYKRRAVPKTFRTVCGTAATHTTCAAPIAHTNLVYPGAAGVSPVFPCSVFTKGACRKRPPRPAR